ncbi:MAG: transcriptional activator NhaR [Kofleriaceae bacterium]|nr:transcriptional activator NhaR [Kofleriaceae bacterium]
MTSRQALHRLNYHHLQYYWLVVREGGLVPAAKLLRLSHPTLSTQIHALEDQLGEKLLEKVGRKLVPTEMGKIVYRYAEDIFALGHEMIETVYGRSSGQPLRLNIGIVDVLPKLVVRRLLEPALRLAQSIRLACYEDRYERLLGDLAAHTLDLVISDAPVPPGSNIRAFNHVLGETELGLFGTPDVVRKLRRDFPRSLEGARMLLPLERSPQRRALNQWFDRHDVRPNIIAEFEDSALLKVFGAGGFGVFPAQSVVTREIIAQYRVAWLGRLEGVRERFYAISIERKLKHPGVVAISNSAREDLFGRAEQR